MLPKNLNTNIQNYLTETFLWVLETEKNSESNKKITSF